MSEKSKHGGARPGAGRPAGKEKTVKSFSISPEVYAALEDYSYDKRMPKSAVVETALRKFLDIKEDS